ncbi:hypothetical protein [Clostridium cochlearium]|uniref:hypothetical protein n=1 Tax=Clostridium cochlearium TaxID=1494 RepID=UPI00241C813B|nr:hypothetical protein [Clostridium cochlearium]MBE6064698.1 hypothetical protein [Clostridium cochlearium]
MIINLFLRVNEKDEPILRVIGAKNAKEKLSINDISLTTGVGLHIANELMRDLNTGIDVKFESFTQYNKLIQNVNKRVNEIHRERI